MLGARPALGRLFVPDDDTPGRAGSVVLAHGNMARRFGDRSGGRRHDARAEREPYRSSGCCRADFSLPREVLPTLGVVEDGGGLPAAAAVARRSHGAHRARITTLLARLRPGVSLEAAQAELDVLTARLRRDFPEIYPPNGGLTFSAVPLLDQVVGNVRRPLFVLTGAVLLVLLIACANVANLQLCACDGPAARAGRRGSRSGPRRGDARRAIPVRERPSRRGRRCHRRRLARAGVAWLRALAPDHLPRLDDVAVDGRVLLFTLVLLGACGRALRARAARCRRRRRSGGRAEDPEAGQRPPAARCGAAAIGCAGCPCHRRAGARRDAGHRGGAAHEERRADCGQVEPGFDARRRAHLRAGDDRPGVSRWPERRARTYRELWPRLEALPGVGPQAA